METAERLIDAALSLALRQSWTSLTLADIAREAGLGLDVLARDFASKSAILAGYARHVDRQLLASLASDPVEGGTHDRLFDIMLRRFEIMAPQRLALAAIARDGGQSPADWPALLQAGLEQQGWTLAAAGLASDGLRADALKLGLARIQAQTFRVWLEDDDAGLARTMASLDRNLRDGADLFARIERPLAIAAALYRGFRARRGPGPRPATSETDAAYATAD